MAIRADKRKNMKKVAKVALAYPLMTQQEMADKAQVSIGTVNANLKELEKLGDKDPKIIEITDQDLVNVKAMQKIVAEKIADPDEMSKTRIGELAQAMKEATARYSLFRGNATDDKGGLKDITINI